MTGGPVLVTGADGFIGRHMVAALAGRPVLRFVRGDADLGAKVAAADAVVHLAGANRPPDPAGFRTDNAELAASLAAAVRAAPGRRRTIVFASSTQAMLDNDYGRSKRDAEAALAALADTNDVAILRLPGVFGPGARPRYNSVVATFCDAAARGEPLPVNDPAAPLTLVHVDDVVAHVRALITAPPPGLSHPEVAPLHRTTVGEVAAIITACANGQAHPDTPLARALAATYASVAN